MATAEYPTHRTGSTEAVPAGAPTRPFGRRRRTPSAAAVLGTAAALVGLLALHQALAAMSGPVRYGVLALAALTAAGLGVVAAAVAHVPEAVGPTPLRPTAHHPGTAADPPAPDGEDTAPMDVGGLDGEHGQDEPSTPGSATEAQPHPGHLPRPVDTWAEEVVVPAPREAPAEPPAPTRGLSQTGAAPVPGGTTGEDGVHRPDDEPDLPEPVDSALSQIDPVAHWQPGRHTR